MFNLFSNKRGVSSINVILISLTVLLLGVSSYALILFSDLLDSNTIYKGIYVNEMDVSGMTKQELEQFLIDNEKNVLDQKKITVKYNDSIREIKFPDVGMTVNIDETVEKVWNIGREGSKKDRVFDIMSAYLHPKEFYTKVTYDNIAVEKVITDIYDEVFVERVDNSYEVEGDKLILIAGTDGKEMDRAKLAEEIYTSLDRLENAEFQVSINVYPRRNVDSQQIFDEVYEKEEPAEFKVENNEVKIIPEKPGKTIDKEILDKCVNELMDNENVTIPLTIQTVVPTVKKENLEDNLFKDVLDKRKTVFNTYDQNTINRGHNIRLVAEKIKGKILAPGEVFSFNEVVGERTAARGFKDAHVYTSGKIVDGIGGGICQVSSLLYNIALYSGLEIVERVNHQFTVSYVDLGTDATVSWGTIDFKFRNDTDWPMKVDCIIEQNSIEIYFYGTNEYPERKVTVETNVEQEYPAKVIEEKVTTLAPGQKIVKQYGMTGYYVTAKRIFKNGDETVVEQLNPSWYSRLDQIVQVGVEKE